MFTSLEEAARGLLLTTCRLLGASGVTYVVAGGWVPVLRGGLAELEHPGTRDVDILLSDKPDQLSGAVEQLLQAGFVPSAKHDFQLLLPVSVGGREFIFNVDLMHPAEQQKSPGLFADLFDLGVDDHYDPTGKRWVKSVVFKSSAIVFEENLWSYVRVSGLDVNRAPCTIKVPLLNETALILSKTESAQIAKRTRDAFDIYFLLCGSHGPQISADLSKMSAQFPQVATQLNLLKTWIEAKPEVFDANVALHAKRLITGASRDVAKRLPT